jgi:serine/threonine-protein kinase
LFEAVSGARPFEGRDTAEVLRRITQGDVPPLSNRTPHEIEFLSPAFQRILAADPRRRPSSAAEFGAELTRLRSDRLQE